MPQFEQEQAKNDLNLARATSEMRLDQIDQRLTVEVTALQSPLVGQNIANSPAEFTIEPGQDRRTEWLLRTGNRPFR